MPCIATESLLAIALADNFFLTPEEFDHLDSCGDCLEERSACIAESGCRRLLEERDHGGSAEN